MTLPLKILGFQSSSQTKKRTHERNTKDAFLVVLANSFQDKFYAQPGWYSFWIEICLKKTQRWFTYGIINERKTFLFRKHNDIKCKNISEMFLFVNSLFITTLNYSPHAVPITQPGQPSTASQLPITCKTIQSHKIRIQDSTMPQQMQCLKKKFWAE